jgi:NADP-dependent aldehyde dehydrogenase
MTEIMTSPGVQGYDPRTAAPAGEPVPLTSSAEIEATVARAATAFPAWGDWPARHRAEALERIAAAVENAADDLVTLADLETALGAARLHGELARTTGQLRLFAEVLRDGNYVDAVITTAEASLGRPDMRRMLRPVGPCAVFSASNFPFAFSVLGGDTASALAAGCPVVVKAHEAHPRTSVRTYSIARAALEDAGAPDGVLGIVFGVEAGRRLVTHPVIKAVGFTGSQHGGRALFDLAAARPDPIPFYGEFGSVNPVFVLPHAAQSRAAEIAAGYAGSLTLGGGQFCTNPGLLFVPANSGLIPAITDAAAARPPSPMLSRSIHEAYVRGTGALGQIDGVRLLARGTADRDGGWWAVPQVHVTDLDTFAQHGDGLAQECFGPSGLVVTYHDGDALLRVAESLDGNLTASVHADAGDMELAARLEAPLRQRAGRLIFNGWPTGVAVAWATHHGGPWPSTSAAGYTSVGATAIARWLVPVAYQNWPDELLPEALRDANPLGLARRVDATFPG